YSLRTNRRISEVFPTPPSPIRASFAFMCRTVGIGIGRAPHPEPGYKQFRRVDRETRITDVNVGLGRVHERSARRGASPTDRFQRIRRPRSRGNGAQLSRPYRGRSMCRELKSARTSLTFSDPQLTSSSCDLAPTAHA